MVDSPTILQISAARAVMHGQIETNHQAKLDEVGRLRIGRTIRVPFGPHRGRLLEDVPLDYLRWLAPWAANEFGVALVVYLGGTVEDDGQSRDDP